MNLFRLFPILLLLILIFVGIKLLYRSRATAMRALATRWGFQYTKGDPKIWYLPKGHIPQPTSFRLRGYPVNTISRMWNVIEGEKNGIRVLVVDTTMGVGRGQGGKGVYSTLIAARTDKNPFADKGPKEKIAHSNGWTALYRIRFWQVPWTLSIQRIEEHLTSLQI
jgi:hypothetical protein